MHVPTEITSVLNLIITGIPSIQWYGWLYNRRIRVLNLIITGIPSILKSIEPLLINEAVLNLIITGIPSIPLIWIRILILW